jgi:hypothetical protein
MRSRTPIGAIRPLDADDPRNPNHPSQRANWLALMRELGRIAAAQEWERQHESEGNNDETKGSCSLRPIL